MAVLSPESQNVIENLHAFGEDICITYLNGTGVVLHVPTRELHPFVVPESLHKYDFLGTQDHRPLFLLDNNQILQAPVKRMKRPLAKDLTPLPSLDRSTNPGERYAAHTTTMTSQGALLYLSEAGVTQLRFVAPIPSVTVDF
jgi:hypothetical protein